MDEYSCSMACGSCSSGGCYTSSKRTYQGSSYQSNERVYQ